MAERLLEIQAAVEATPELAMRDDAVGQAGWEATPAPMPPTEGEGKKRGRPQQPPPGNWLSRRRDGTDQGLAVLSAFRRPFDTHQGEWDIRMVQVKQKVSGGFCTLEGAQGFGRIRGDSSTARKQATNVFAALRDACAGSPFIPSSAMQ